MTKKQKILNNQIEYEEIVKKINKYSSCYIFLSVEYYKWYYFVARIISFGAFLKGRKSRATHTASIYKFGVDPRIVEATAQYGGVNHRGLYDAYFTPKFHGKVTAHIMPCKFIERDRRVRSTRIEHEDLGTRYAIKKAYASWFDWGKKKIQKDKADIVYCSDYILDDYELCTKKEFVGNNAEITPAELEDMLEDDVCIRLVIRDTKGQC